MEKGWTEMQYLYMVHHERNTYICYEIYMQIVCVRPVVIRRKRQAQMDTKQPNGVRANLET